MKNFFEPTPNKEPIKLSEHESAEGSLKTEGGLSYYEQQLQLTDEDFAGKKVLDLGSGPSALFAKEAGEKIPGIKVTSFDLSFDESKLEERGDIFNSPRIELRTGKSKSVKKLESGTEKVTGLFTQLPFDGESFDIVVSSGAMPLYLTDPEKIQEAFGEVIRVLRDGGKAHLGPVTYTDIVDTDFTKSIAETHQKHSCEESKKIFEAILGKFQKKIRFEFLPPIEKYPGTEFSRIISPEVLVIRKKDSRKPLFSF
ncbi:MAG: class I SAM-dependent methyltransferase [bacterium]|nr:class I SAM-dependent methyltransferase [bacterium]